MGINVFFLLKFLLVAQPMLFSKNDLRESPIPVITSDLQVTKGKTRVTTSVSKHFFFV